MRINHNQNLSWFAITQEIFFLCGSMSLVCVRLCALPHFLTALFPFVSTDLSTKCVPSLFFPPFFLLPQPIFSLLSQLFPAVNSFLALLLEQTDVRNWRAHCGTVGDQAWGGG